MELKFDLIRVFGRIWLDSLNLDSLNFYFIFCYMVVILIESNYDKIFIKYFGIIFIDKHINTYSLLFPFHYLCFNYLLFKP
jgi:hypothetical protein